MLVYVALLTKLKEGPICRQIGLERDLFVGKLGLCTPPTIFVSFAPVEVHFLNRFPLAEVLLTNAYIVSLWCGHSQFSKAIFSPYYYYYRSEHSASRTTVAAYTIILHFSLSWAVLMASVIVSPSLSFIALVNLVFCRPLDRLPNTIYQIW